MGHTAQTEIDPITVAVVRETLASVVREMRGLMIRSSYSSIIYEGFDFSCAIFDAKGRLIAQSGEDHPFHVIPLAFTVRHLLDRLERRREAVGPDDIFLHNDPYSGGTHLNDVAVIWPVFDAGRHVAFVVVRSHWADIGGTTAGSLSGAASEILHEGIRLDCIRVDRAGGGPVLDLIWDNVRLSDEAMADFEVVLGTCRVAEARLNRLHHRYGRDVVRRAIDGLLAASDRRMRARIAPLPDGRYTGTGYLDGNDPALFPLDVHVAIEIDGDSLRADFTGTRDQVPAPLNAGLAIAATSVLTIVKSFLDPAGLINEGTMAPIGVDAPKGCLLNATWPAPCGGLNEVRFAADAAVMSALAYLIPDRMTGDVRGTSNHTYISGYNAERGRPFIFYEYPSGGTGAFAGHDGNPAVRAFNEGENVSIQSAEVVEAVFPLKVRRSELRPDSGGPGRWRGGVGLWREIELLCDDARLSLLSDRNLVTPAGVNGGRAGAGNRTTVRRNGTEIEPAEFPGKVAGFRLRRGDIVVMRSSGGGGFGTAALRAPSAIATDLKDGLVSPEGMAAYGEATDETLATLAAADDGMALHRARLSSELWDQFDLSSGQMIEIVPQTGAVRRFWVDPDPAASTGPTLEIAAGAMEGLPDEVALRVTRSGTPAYWQANLAHG